MAANDREVAMNHVHGLAFAGRKRDGRARRATPGRRLRRYLERVFRRRTVAPSEPVVAAEPLRLSPQAEQPAAAQVASPLNDATLAQVRADLAALLDRHPLARRVLPALARLEHALAKPAAAGVERMSGAELLACCEHLDESVAAWRSAALWVLRVHLQAVLRALHPGLKPAACAPRSAVSVEECTLTAFMDVAQEWERRLEHEPQR